MLIRMRKEMGDDVNVTSGNQPADAPLVSSPFSSITPEIDALVLLDRDVDLITPMMTMLTYEGLIDEFIGIRNSIN